MVLIFQLGKNNQARS